MEFRGALGNASGFQSYQYRKLEFLLGNKNREAVQVFAHDEKVYNDLCHALESPSLYDEFIRYLFRRGYKIPRSAGSGIGHCRTFGMMLWWKCFARCIAIQSNTGRPTRCARSWWRYKSSSSFGDSVI
jgi:hypothetical protein